MGFFLLIIAGLVAWFFISAMNRAKRRMAFADQRMAQHHMDTTADRDLIPTWARSRPNVNAFVEAMYVLVEGRSVPPTFFTGMMEDPEVIAELMHYIALVEREGASMSDQRAAAAQFVFERWLVLPHDQQEPFMDSHIRKMMGSAYRTPAG